MRNLFKMNINQMWFNAQKMEREERKHVIKYIIGLSSHKGSFIDYSAKYFMAELIDNSECYFNKTGTSTPVKEFKKLGWYVESGKKFDGTPMYKLDFNKVMEEPKS